MKTQLLGIFVIALFVLTFAAGSGWLNSPTFSDDQAMEAIQDRTGQTVVWFEVGVVDSKSNRASYQLILENNNGTRQEAHAWCTQVHQEVDCEIEKK